MMYRDEKVGLSYSLDGLLEKISSHGYTVKEYNEYMGYKSDRTHAWSIGRWAIALPYLCDAAGLFKCRLSELIKFDFENEYTMCNASWEVNDGVDISFQPLRDMLYDKGMTVKQLMVEMGIERNYDGDWAKTTWFNNDREPPLRYVYLVCKYLNCNIDCVVMNTDRE